MGITLKQLSDTVQKVKTYIDNKLDNLNIDSEQVQSDWAETDTSSTSYIMNKPTIPEAYDDTEIRNKINVIEEDYLTSADKKSLLEKIEALEIPDANEVAY